VKEHLKLVSQNKLRSCKQTDDPRRPVWLEATESFYKKLNRIANECKLSRYEAPIENEDRTGV
jgi:chromosome segregation and condensation protein ScpB